MILGLQEDQKALTKVEILWGLDKDLLWMAHIYLVIKTREENTEERQNCSRTSPSKT